MIMLYPLRCLRYSSAMQTQSRTWIIIGIIVLLLIAGAVFLFNRPNGSTPHVTNNATSTGNTTATSSNATATSTGGYTVEKIEIDKIPPAPSFSAPLKCSSSVSADVCANLKIKAAADAAVLAKDPTDSMAWINLGTVRKIAGDYIGAETAWKYVSTVYPKNSISYANLGDLYMNFLHKYPEAEVNYLRQIANKPGDLNAYETLFTLYTTLYLQNTASAENILKKGITTNPTATNLQVLLARYYKSHGRIAEAQATYAAAAKNARAQGNTALATQIEQEAAQ
jgi:tetratricopeptide (TPR) repeat protein